VDPAIQKHVVKAFDTMKDSHHDDDRHLVVNRFYWKLAVTGRVFMITFYHLANLRNSYWRLNANLRRSTRSRNA